MVPAPSNLQITVVGTAILLVVAGVVWFGVGGDAEPPPVDDAGPAVVSTVGAGITVHVSGSVVRPGVVVLAHGARVADAVAAAGGASANADLGTTNLAAPVRDGEHVTIPAVGDPATVTGVGATGIDLNTSDAAALESLPGVGPVLAARIVAFRTEHGPFGTVEDLLDVPGIGEAKLAQMREAITVP